MRYVLMSSVSEYCSVKDFILDKFPPPYHSSVESWVIGRFEKALEISIRMITSDIVELQTPIFINKKRREDSLGGSIKIPSIWSDYTCCDLQDFLDDMFLYVHTIKEPSNIHHENIKAIETIVKFQKQFESLPLNRILGAIKQTEDFKTFFLDKNILGFSHDVLQHSIKHTLDTIRHIDLGQIWEKIKEEKLCYTTSTKSVIPEYSRYVETSVSIDDKGFWSKTEHKKNTKKKSNNLKDEILGSSKFKRPTIEKKDEKYIRVTNIEDCDTLKGLGFSDEYIKRFKEKYGLDVAHIKLPSMIITPNSKGQVLQGANRCKVHDAILDFIMVHPEIDTTYKLACWNIFQNNSRVTADISIKAQYGAKREFYIMNLGAKMMARVFEQFFLGICKQIDNEMISVSDDKKILNMK